MADDYNFGTYTGDGEMGEALMTKTAAIAVFAKKAVLMPFASKEAGRPIFESFDFVKVLTPGERDEVERKVEPWDKIRWKDRWEAYSKGADQDTVGTPLNLLFPMNPEIVENMAVLRFRTVEQLAEASDSSIAAIAMGGVAWREKARRYLEGSKDSSRFAAIEARQDAQDVALSDLRAGKAAAEEEAAELRRELVERERENVELLRQLATTGATSAGGGVVGTRGGTRARRSASDAIGDVEIAR